MPTILITGGHDLLGSRVVRRFADELPDSRLIVIGPTASPSRHTRHPRIDDVPGDLNDERLWAALPKTITHVIHLAAVIPGRNEDVHRAGLLTDNLLPLAHLVDQSRRWPNLEQVIYGSSVSVYAPSAAWLREDSPTRPANLYAATKFAGEGLLQFLATGGAHTVSLRFSSVYGCGQRVDTVLPTMVDRARHGQDIVIFGDGTRTEDFLYVDDAVCAIWQCFQRAAHGVYNVGTGTPVSLTDLAQTIAAVYARSAARIVYRPRPDADTGIKLDISRARADLDYAPTMDLRGGLERLKCEMDDAGA